MALPTINVRQNYRAKTSNLAKPDYVFGLGNEYENASQSQRDILANRARVQGRGVSVTDLESEMQRIGYTGTGQDDKRLFDYLIGRGVGLDEMGKMFDVPQSQIESRYNEILRVGPQNVAQNAELFGTFVEPATGQRLTAAQYQNLDPNREYGTVSFLGGQTTQQAAEQANQQQEPIPAAQRLSLEPTAQEVAQQAAQQARQQQQQTASGLPTELTNIPVDNDYSMDEAAVIENLIRSGRISTQQVSDYFNIPVADINRVLGKDFGYTQNNLNQALAGQGIIRDAYDEGDGTRMKATGAGTNIFSGMNTAEDQALARQMGMSALEYAQAGGLGANVDINAIRAAQQGVGQDLTNVMGGQQGYTGGTLQDGNIRYNDPNVIGGQVNMPQVGVIGAEAALQGGLQGGLAGLQEGLATGATGLTGAVASGLQELRRALGQGRQDITAGYGRAEEGFQPYMQGGAAAQSQLEALTGARGQEAFQQAYQESPYIQFLREQGMRANLAGAAATGGLGGGNVQKELARFGQGLASQGLQQQIENLRGLTGQGLQAAQGAGQYAAGGAGQLAGLEQTQGTQALGAMQNVGQQLANLGLAGGQTAAQMGYGTGQSLADIRTRAGELMAGEISNVSRDTANIASALGGNISNVYGTQAQQIAQLLVNSGMSQADAAQQTAQMLANISTGSAGQVTGLGTSVGNIQQTEGILSGIGDAASGIGTLIRASDFRLKENLNKIGQLPSGLGLYSWDWKESAPSDAKNDPTIGVIAQEVQQLIPEAIVQRADGYMAVDYSKVN